MTHLRHARFVRFGLLMAGLVGIGRAAADERLPPMLDLPLVGQDSARIDFDSLPVVDGRHGVVTRGDAAWNFRLHSYLAFFDRKYWCMWSHGPVVEDNPTQHVRYATSADGLTWSEPCAIVGPSPNKGFRYISRGFWLREDKLLALASHDEAFDERGKVRFFGPSLQLLTFRWDAADRQWNPLGVLFDDAINNFPPRMLPDGQWGLLCRDHRRRVSMLIGGTESPLTWQASPVAAYAADSGFRPEEPDWWTLPDGRLLGLFRDNGKSHRLYRAVSGDNGRSWSLPEQTNFPDATSKFFGLRTTRGYWVLISNPNPRGRNPLCLATSDDGITFTRMARLPIPETLPGDEFASANASTRYESLQYPHAIEQDGTLLIAYSRRKQVIEVVQVSLDTIDELMAASK